MKRKVLFLTVIIFFLLHQDFWFWNDPTLVLGFLPVGLAYHALYCVAASLLWFLVTRYAWPDELEAFAQRTGRGKESSGE